MSRVLTNTFWLATGEIAGRLLRIILIIYSARVLGASAWGISSYILSFAVFFTIFTDIGLGAIITRQLVKDHDHHRHYLGTFLGIKILLLGIATLIIIFIIPYIGALPISLSLTIALALLVIFDSIRLIPTAVNRARETMHNEAYITIVTQGAILIIGIIMLSSMPSAERLTIAYAAGSAIGTLYALYTIRTYLPGIATSFKPSLVKELMNDAWPIALIGLLGSVMLNTDIIMIGWMRTAEEVGYYSAAQKIIFVLYVIPSIVGSAIFPAMMRLTHDRAAFKRFFETALANLLMVALPIMVGGILTASAIINLVYSNAYMPATISFIILLLTIPISYASIIMSNVLIAHNEQKKFIAYAAIGVIGNIVLNFLFIPLWGIAGASFATVFTQMITVVCMGDRVKSITPFSIARPLIKTIIATLGMAFVVYALLAAHVSFFIILLVAIIVYAFILYLLKEPALFDMVHYARAHFLTHDI